MSIDFTNIILIIGSNLANDSISHFYFVKMYRLRCILYFYLNERVASHHPPYVTSTKRKFSYDPFGAGVRGMSIPFTSWESSMRLRVLILILIG